MIFGYEVYFHYSIWLSKLCFSGKFNIKLSKLYLRITLPILVFNLVIRALSERVGVGILSLTTTLRSIFIIDLASAVSVHNSAVCGVSLLQ